MPEDTLPTLDLASPEATSDLALHVAPRLKAGDTLLLEGPIGAGKTHFARAIIKARLAQVGRDEDVPSPTFTLVQTYVADVEIWHADLYRLSDPGEIVELGLEDAFEDAICLVEWPDRLPEAPPGAITLDFVPIGTGDQRCLTIRTGAERWHDLSADLSHAG